MTTLTVWREDAPERTLAVTSDGKEIARLLNEAGVRFERWRAARKLPDGAGPDDVLAAYADEVARLKREGGYVAADVVRLPKGAPDTAPMRRKFLSEHTHGEDEVRFFVEGSGAFYLRIGGKVHQLVCEKDDLIGVPAGARHWFDMGPEPHFCCIRLFNNPEGWVAQYTGDAIADAFPKFALAET